MPILVYSSGIRKHRLYMARRISAFAGVTVFVMLLLISPLLLSIPGGRVGVYLLAASGALVGAACAITKRLRYLSVAAVIFAVFLAWKDHEAGIAFQYRIQHIRSKN